MGKDAEPAMERETGTYRMTAAADELRLRAVIRLPLHFVPCAVQFHESLDELQYLRHRAAMRGRGVEGVEQCLLRFGEALFPYQGAGQIS